MESAPPINTVRYQLTREEVIAQIWRMMGGLKLILSMAFVFLCGVGMFLLRPGQSLAAWAFILFPLFFVFFYRRFVYTLVDQHPEYLELQTVTFDESGVTFTNSVSQIMWPWQRIRGITDRGDSVVLRFDTLGSAGIIPARALSPEQRERLLSYAKAKAA